MKALTAFIVLFALCFLTGCADVSVYEPPDTREMPRAAFVTASASEKSPVVGAVLADEGAVRLSVVLRYADGMLASHTCYYVFRDELRAQKARDTLRDREPYNELVLENRYLTVTCAVSPFTGHTPDEAAAVFRAVGYEVIIK